MQYIASLHCKEKIDLSCPFFIYGDCCSIANYQTEIPAIFQGIFRIFLRYSKFFIYLFLNFSHVPYSVLWKRGWQTQPKCKTE